MPDSWLMVAMQAGHQLVSLHQGKWHYFHFVTVSLLSRPLAPGCLTETLCQLEYVSSWDTYRV